MGFGGGSPKKTALRGRGHLKKNKGKGGGGSRKIVSNSLR